jgi:hypothetical protein
MLAGGRAAFAVTILVSLGLIIFSRFIHVRDKFFVLIAVIISIPAVGVIGFQYIFTRFATSGDNGRIVMSEYLWSQIEKYPWTGIGFGHQYWDTPEEVSIVVGSLAAHNDYLRILVELGYFGATAFYILMTMAIFKASLQNGHFNFTVIVSFVGFLILSNSDNAISTPPYFPLLLIAILSNFVPVENASKYIIRSLSLRRVKIFNHKLLRWSERRYEG